MIISTSDDTFGRQSLEGVLVGGRFKVLKLLGKGAAGEVYLAEHADLGRQYAVKVLKETVEADPNTVARFRREARAAGRLEHPNIVFIADFGRMEDGQLYLVMEYVPGDTLQEVIKTAPGGKLPRSRALEILRQTATALDAAHEAGVVHRDIKPGNILLSHAPGGGDRVKILDFGLAKIMLDSELNALTARGEMFGTPAYMSPEQARGDSIDANTDLYALGVLGFELLTGRLPFTAKSIPRMMLAHQSDPVPDPQSLLAPGEPPLPMAIKEMVMQCLAKDPRHRPASAAVLVQAIGEVDASQLTSTVAMPVVQELSPHDQDLVSTVGGAGFAEAMKTALDQQADSTARRVWALDQAGMVGRALATQMLTLGLGGARLSAALSELGELDHQQIGLETELSVLRSRLQEQEVRSREWFASLRYAVADLSVERGRFVDAGDAGTSMVLDIDYQIRELEKRLGEVSLAQEDDQARVVAQLREAQARLDLHHQTLSNAGRKLVGVVYEVRPDPCPTQFLGEYEALDLLMKGAFGA